MINMNKSPAKRRGRSPKKAPTMDDMKKQMEDVAVEEGAKQAETFQKAAEAGDGPFVFKSKYREDIVWLETPREEKRPDGGRFVSPGKKAEFHRNTWTTHDPLEAQLLRDKIDERKGRDPYHIVETTPT